MKLLLISQNFYPENFKSNDIAFTLSKKGYEVDVLTGIPNYPKGSYFESYGLFKKRYEKIDNINIYRVFQTSRGKNASNLSLSLNYLTFMISATFWVLYLAIFKKYNLIFVHQTSPITQAIPAVLIKWLKGIPLYTWVLDLWPDSVILGANTNNRLLIKSLDRIVKFVYKNSDKILISSKRFENLILQKGDYKNKIIYFPNWSEDFLIEKNKNIPALPEGFIIMMAGNMGVAQTLDAVLKAALELKDDKTIKWVLLGDGSKKSWAEEYVKQNSLQDTVYFMGIFPLENMPTFYKKSNAMLITLKADYPHIKAVVPARLISYMAASRPVLAMSNGGVNDIIKESNCGYAVNAEDYMALVKVIREKVLPFQKEFASLGVNGRIYFEENFTKEKCINNLIEIMKNK